MKAKTKQKIRELRKKMIPKANMSISESNELFIYGDITDPEWTWWCGGVSSKEVRDFLDENKDAQELTVHVNSCGGDVFEGVTIYNLLKNASQKITIIIDGCACSAASVIAMAGDTVIMNPGTLLMIHNAWTTASGNADELRKVADDLDTIMESNRQIYLQKANISEEKLIELLNEETWLSPEKAKEYGFCDEIKETEQPADPEPNDDDFEEKVKSIAQAIIEQKLQNMNIEPQKPADPEPKSSGNVGFFGFGNKGE